MPLLCTATNPKTNLNFEVVVMYLGFTMAAYSVVGNDTIQTLGTFLSSNERKK